MIVAEPVAFPLHKTFVTAVPELTAVAGSVMVTVFIVLQPLASVTVAVRTPAAWPVITEPVAPVDHI